MNRNNRTKLRLVLALIGLTWAGQVLGAPPFINLQGVGGAGFNPLAYTAGRPDEESFYSKPQFGAWYVHLGDVHVDWTTIGVAGTLFDRLEWSYGYEAIGTPGDKNIRKSNIGAKINLIPENLGGQEYIPAVSVGAIWKNTSHLPEETDEDAIDYYLVATKLITQLPRPVLLTAGVLNTKEQVTGVFGYNDNSDTTAFAHVAVLPLARLAIGAEYKQGATYGDFKNADYWNVHAVWLANEHLSLIGTYVNAGNEKSESRAGLGEGVALSVQYTF